MAKISAFEKNYVLYETWFENNPYVYKAEVESVKQLLPKGEGIEIGIGSGRFALPLGIKKGIEPSKKMAEISKNHGLEVIPGVAENLPIENNSVDFALMVTTICFVDDSQKAIDEAFRVIKPNGTFICAFVDKESPIGKMYLKYQSENLFYKEATFFSVNEIKSYMENSGFNSFEFRQTIFDSIENIRKDEKVTDGYGDGSFVVIKGKKGII